MRRGLELLDNYMYCFILLTNITLDPFLSWNSVELDHWGVPNLVKDVWQNSWALYGLDCRVTILGFIGSIFSFQWVDSVGVIVDVNVYDADLLISLYWTHFLGWFVILWENRKFGFILILLCKRQVSGCCSRTDFKF